MPGRRTLLITAAGAITLTSVLSAAPAGAAAGPATPVPGLNNLRGVTCPTAASCVAVGNDSNLNGKSVIITAATGKVKAWPGKLTGQDPNAVACPPAARKCLTVADDAVATVAVSTGAMKVTATPPPPSGGIVALGALACPKTCYAAGFEGAPGSSSAVLLHLSAAGKILSTTTDTGTGISAIACPAASLCLMSDYAKPTESIQVVNSGHIGASHAFPADTYVQAIACHQASLCYALGGNTTSSPELTDELFPLNPKTGAIGAMATISGDFSGEGLSCISTTTCLAAGFTDSPSEAPAVVTVTSGTLGKPAHYTGLDFTSAACATTSKCYAVGLGSSGAIVDKVTR